MTLKPYNSLVFSHQDTLPFEFRIGLIYNFTCDYAETLVIPRSDFQNNLEIHCSYTTSPAMTLKTL